MVSDPLCQFQPAYPQTVLILVVMEYGLRLFISTDPNLKGVLILVVMEYGLRLQRA